MMPNMPKGTNVECWSWLMERPVRGAVIIGMLYKMGLK